MSSVISRMRTLMTYRALRIARGDETPLPVDEKRICGVAGADRRPIAELVGDLSPCVPRRWRCSWHRCRRMAARGSANGNPVTVRALAHIITGPSATTSRSSALVRHHRAVTPLPALDKPVAGRDRLLRSRHRTAERPRSVASSCEHCASIAVSSAMLPRAASRPVGEPRHRA